ncbi:pyrroline-5-carboxylate reductase [Natronincola ferrireducens]|uniref:Pyrroline-5-carboxylate reductase n=1 Tax=Natronincola ferrireducens TaxID=393762 RepID=A0A1G8YFP4_9FIRM|nr:pyrroline-5-carboxylate reductase [Natronincola ferrireducens]SDK01055.1 pyrroline-5-carboxylate reductase [Natronincola ferrireducens]
MKRKIGIIGAGNIAYSIVKGLVDTFPEIHENIYISNRTFAKAETFKEAFNVQPQTSNIEVVKKCDIILLTVKPNAYKYVLEEIKEFIREDQIIVSIAAGISIKYIEGFYHQPIKIVRTMTNTSVLVGEGMTALAPNQQVTKEELDDVCEIFKSIGKIDVIEEEHLDVVASISASSPAYVYMFIEALADGGVLEGMSRKKAYQYAAQAVLGAAKMVLETQKHPGELKDMICSPAGITIEAVYALERNHFRASIIEAMEACTAKSKELIDK